MSGKTRKTRREQTIRCGELYVRTKFAKNFKKLYLKQLHFIKKIIKEYYKTGQVTQNNCYLCVFQ